MSLPSLRDDRGLVVAERGTRQLRIRLDSGKEYVANRGELGSTRTATVGDRVRLVSRGSGVRNVALVDEGEAPPDPRAPGAPAPSRPSRPLPPTLRRAVDAALAAGDSAMTIASRHGIAVEQVRP